MEDSATRSKSYCIDDTGHRSRLPRIDGATPSRQLAKQENRGGEASRKRLRRKGWWNAMRDGKGLGSNNARELGEQTRERERELGVNTRKEDEEL